jgi:hypothetical protein
MRGGWLGYTCNSFAQQAPRRTSACAIGSQEAEDPVTRHGEAKVLQGTDALVGFGQPIRFNDGGSSVLRGNGWSQPHRQASTPKAIVPFSAESCDRRVVMCS